MTQEFQQTMVVVVDPADGCWSGMLTDDAALTLIAVASEDPATWQEMVALWPRYRSPAVPEFADLLPLQRGDWQTARQQLIERGDRWVAIDLVQRRVLTGPDFQTVGRDQRYAMVVEEDGQQHWIMSIHLPPWWELVSPADRGMLDRPGETPALIPATDRNFLYGRPLIEDLAQRILDIVESPRWTTADHPERDSRRYPLTVQVHRAWLMTPRPELQGRCPRQLLHGGREWIDRLIWGQQLRVPDTKELVPIPTDLSRYATAPMGTDEISIYFDLCRELIQAGWEWWDKVGAQLPPETTRSARQRELAAYLAHIESIWLELSSEQGAPPLDIIEYNRRRVPLMTTSADIEAPGDGEHDEDCECPICTMMAEEGMGVGFVAMDGHHLELDDEFAFSLHETFEEWQAAQRDMAAMNAEFEQEAAAEELETDADEEDPFAPIWDGLTTEEPLPGDSRGHVKLAFLLAEIVGVLEHAGATKPEIKELNRRFRDFRHEWPETRASAKRLCDYLEQLAQQYPAVLSRAADFQSRIDESLRQPHVDDDSSGA